MSFLPPSSSQPWWKPKRGFPRQVVRDHRDSALFFSGILHVLSSSRQSVKKYSPTLLVVCEIDITSATWQSTEAVAYFTRFLFFQPVNSLQQWNSWIAFLRNWVFENFSAKFCPLFFTVTSLLVSHYENGLHWICHGVPFFSSRNCRSFYFLLFCGLFLFIPFDFLCTDTSSLVQIVNAPGVHWAFHQEKADNSRWYDHRVGNPDFSVRTLHHSEKGCSPFSKWKFYEIFQSNQWHDSSEVCNHSVICLRGYFSFFDWNNIMSLQTEQRKNTGRRKFVLQCRIGLPATHMRFWRSAIVILTAAVKHFFKAKNSFVQISFVTFSFKATHFAYELAWKVTKFTDGQLLTFGLLGTHESLV